MNGTPHNGAAMKGEVQRAALPSYWTKPAADRFHDPAASCGVSGLVRIATAGLARMFDAERQLFCFRLNQTEHGLLREGFSSRYTVMSLLGLHRLECSGGQSPLPLKAAVDTCLRLAGTVPTLGDLGLALWLCAEVGPERLPQVYEELAVGSALTRFKDARQRTTMHLAWFLSGLAHAASVPGTRLAGLGDWAVKTADLLKANQGRGGYFGHSSRTAGLAGPLRGHIGSFADQVYPIYALSRFAQVFESRDAVAPAMKCADAICRAQGPLGQWWWHYDAQSGAVFESYPVYSVHQHGMAPMALFALEEASRVEFNESIYRGLAWISENNEFGVDLRDAHAGVIWRCLYPQRSVRKYIVNGMRVCGLPMRERNDNLRIRWECRPYELGWLLYAFATRQNERHFAAQSVAPQGFADGNS